MKRFKCLALLVSGVLVFSIVASAQPVAQQPEEIIRIHIRAHDDSEAEQQKKQEVRDEVNLYLSPILGECLNKEEAERALTECIPEIERIGEEVSGRVVQATLCMEEFPERTYGDVVYPAGEYEALIVEIGDGAGANWWCVAFPPMCYTSAKSIPSATGNASGKTVKVKYRSWIWERFKSVFQKGRS